MLCTKSKNIKTLLVIDHALASAILQKLDEHLEAPGEKPSMCGITKVFVKEQRCAIPFFQWRQKFEDRKGACKTTLHMAH